MGLRSFYLCTLLAVALGSSSSRLARGQESVPQPDDLASEPAESGPAEAPAVPSPEAGPQASKDRPVDRPAQASPLDTFLLRDGKGNLVPVLGMTFEEFEQLLRLKKGVADPAPPAYSLDSLRLEGTVEGSRANLKVAAKVRLRHDGWVRIPLRMPRAVLRKAPEYDGPGEHFVRYEEPDGYALWLSGQGDASHTVTLEVSLPVASLGGESRLNVILPRATESSLKLLVPLAGAEASLDGGSEGLLSSAPAGEQTEITALGIGGELSLHWQAAQGASASELALEASGQITVSVEGRQRISSDARLIVRSDRGEFDTFRVRLPPGMAFVPGAATGYKATVVETPSAPDAGQSATVVEIKLDRPATGPLEVRLLAALAAPSSGADSSAKPIEPARFEVLSAIAQRGTVDFKVNGDWLLTWSPDATTRRVDPAAAGNGAKGVVARFEYDQQPCGLQVKVEPRPTRIAVEPTYVVYVEPTLVRLEATLKYRMRGAAAQSLPLDLKDWIFAKVEPETIVEVESLDPTARMLTLPLRDGMATGEFEIRLTAHRLLAEGARDLALTLPRPAADVVTPASVVVVPADNIELTPKPREMAGLIADTQPPAVPLPPRQQTPLAYRDLGVAGEARFAWQMNVRTRQSTVAAAAELEFAERLVKIQQRLSYRVLYEPQRSFTLQVPRDLLVRSDLQVLLGAEPLPLVPLTESDSESSRMARVQVTAPEAQIGPCELVVQYSLPLPRLAAGESTTMAVPLVIPDEAVDQAALGQTVTARWSDDLQVQFQPATGTGESAPTIEATAAGELKATAGGLNYPWRFALRTSDPAQSSRLVVRKLWIQTILAGDLRQERAAWQLSGGSQPLRISLPPGAELRGDVAVNGQQVVDWRREEDQLIVPVPPAAGNLVVEVWYTISARSSRPLASLTELAPPTLLGAGHARECYWQVCLAGSEHLVTEPPGFTPELAWSWRGTFWDRSGTRNQQSLEKWIGASEQTPIPAELNSYLFSAFRSPPKLQAVVVSRSVLLWSIGLLVLVIGLMLLHVRALRRPSVLLVLAVVLAAAGLSWPASALVVAQVAAVALLVLAAAAAWQWSVSGTMPYAAPAPPSPSEPKSTAATAPRAQPQPQIPATTATAPLLGVTEPQP